MFKSIRSRLPGWKMRRGLLTPGDMTPAGPALLWYTGALEAWDAEGAANYAASRVGLVLGTVLAEIGGGPVNWLGGTGWSGFLALTRALDTGIVPVNDQSYSAIVKFTAAATGTAEYLFGCYDAGASVFGISPTRTNSVNYHSDGQLVVAPELLAGILAVAGTTGYRNGAPDPGVIPFTTAPAIPSIYIGGLHWGPGILMPTSAAVAKFGVWAPPALTPAEVAARVALM